MFFDGTSYCFCAVSYVAYDGDDGGDCDESGYQHAHGYHDCGHYEEGDGQYCCTLMYYGCKWPKTIK